MATNATLESWIQSAHFYSLREDPALFEAAIHQEIELARTDSTAALIVESIYCDSDRPKAFQRFLEGLEFAAIRRLLAAFNVRPTQQICEIGGGPGYLAWALTQVGFEHVTLLEPSEEFITGTGYLNAIRDPRRLCIVNDLDAFYQSPETYDLVITRNCIHHFRNISYVAACIRTKLRPGGRWLAIREWFAETPAELYERMRTHPYLAKYGTYEFPFPAWHYIEALEIAGFRLNAVVPAGFAADVLSAYITQPGSRGNQRWTQLMCRLLESFPWLTVWLYRFELFSKKHLHGRGTRFTRPPAWLFERLELNGR